MGILKKFEASNNNSRKVSYTDTLCKLPVQRFLEDSKDVLDVDPRCIKPTNILAQPRLSTLSPRPQQRYTDSLSSLPIQPVATPSSIYKPQPIVDLLYMEDTYVEEDYA